jgi:hypothetical protein
MLKYLILSATSGISVDSVISVRGHAWMAIATFGVKNSRRETPAVPPGHSLIVTAQASQAEAK